MIDLLDLAVRRKWTIAQTAFVSVVASLLLVLWRNPLGPLWLEVLVAAVVALPLGLGLGVVLCLLWDRLEVHVWSGDEFASHIGLPLLARVPTLPARQAGAGALAAPSPDEAEVLAPLARAIEDARVRPGANVVAFTSVAEDYERSRTTAGLGLAFAHSGRRVALIDLTLRRRPFAGVFDLDERPGVSAVLLDRPADGAPVSVSPVAGPSLAPRPGGNRRSAALDEVLAIRAQGRAAFAGRTGRGTMLSSPPETDSASDRLARFIGELREQADIVLVDVPSLPGARDTLRAIEPDLLLVVSRLDAQGPESAEVLQALLKRLPTQNLGLVAIGGAAAGD